MLVPVTISVNEPVEDVGEALTVNVDVAVPPGNGVIGPGRSIEIPDGAAVIQE